jgi:CheY-like chemotaxis protein
MDDKDTLLLVEDDLSDARLIMRAIQKAELRIRVVHVKNGDEAVAYLSHKPPYESLTSNPLPCLVLMDLKLPRRSGLEVVQWMREQHSGVERVPVIMLTSSHHAVDIRSAYDLGVNSYLVKPESSHQLLQMMASLKDYWFTYNRGPICGTEQRAGAGLY